MSVFLGIWMIASGCQDLGDERGTDTLVGTDGSETPDDLEFDGGTGDDGGDTGNGGSGGGGPAPNPGGFGRIYHSDLTYLGAFKCPDKNSWAHAKGALAYVPTRNVLVAIGKSFSELEIPQPTISNGQNPAVLKEAYDPLQMFDPMQPLLTALAGANTIGEMTWFENRFWIGTYEYYNVDATDHLGITSIAEDWTDHRGAWRVGPAGVNKPIKNVYHANKTHSDVMVIPETWTVTYAPGRRLAGGRTRGAGAFGSGKGPQLYAFEANENAPSGSTLNGVPLMYFMQSGQIWPGYRNADRYHSIWIWRGDRQALIVGARKGLGPNVYGPGTTCSPDKGWNSHPYEPRMYFIDVDDLGEVALGNRDPWSIRPYEEVMPDEMWNAPGDAGYDSGCKHDWMRGWAFDSERGILYASEPRAYKVPGPSNRMIIHMWQVN